MKQNMVSLRYIWLNYIVKVNKYVYCATSHEKYKYIYKMLVAFKHKI